MKSIGTIALADVINFPHLYGIQEGLIFIAMTSEDLLARTSPYHFHESSPPPSSPSTSPSVDEFYGNTRSSIISTGSAVDSPMRAANENRLRPVEGNIRPLRP